MSKKNWVVVKVGGEIIANKETLFRFAKGIVGLVKCGVNTVVVHGGGPFISFYMKKLGKRPVFIYGLRVTDRETIGVVEMVLSGRVNKEIVAMINTCGGRAVGLSGRDLFTVKARKKPPIQVNNVGKVDLGLVGEVVEVNDELVKVLCEEGYIPVVSPVSVDEKGNPLNVNADEVAACMAAKLGARKLVILTNTPGILYNLANPSSRIPKISIYKLGELAPLIAANGMLPKIDACLQAIKGGVEEVRIAGGDKGLNLVDLVFNSRLCCGTIVTA